MSLSEQIERVDGSQNDILKKILKAFGVTINNEKIDEIAELAEAASNLQDDGILSTATKTAFGLDSSATVNDILSLLSVPYNKVMNPQNRIVGTLGNLNERNHNELLPDKSGVPDRNSYRLE